MTRTRRTPEQVAELLRTSGPLPTAEQVDAHGFNFFPRHWLSRWDEATMPPVLAFLTTGQLDDRGRQYLTRQDLFQLSANVATPQDAVNFYVAVCSWGVGNKARDVYRRLGALTQPEVGQKLLQGILQAKDPEISSKDAYTGFYSHNQYRIKGLGPAFYTKLLYFAAGTEVSRQQRHLILDQKVAKSIGWPQQIWWSPDEYRDYLELIDEVLKLMPEAERADCLEKRLFSL